MQGVNRRTVLALLASSAAGVSARATAVSEAVSEADVAEILRRRIDVEKRAVGMAATIVTPEAQQIICHGRQSASADHLVASDTIFEIGSITKVFTALLLADLARSGVLSVDDPLSKHLPADFVLPQWEGRPITLANLANHTAGLPRFPPMGAPGLTAVASYTIGELKDWIGGLRLSRSPGTEWEYSNVGYALLGLALAHRAERSYDELLKRTILDPAGLTSTFMNPPTHLEERLASGHDVQLNTGPPIELGIFAPAGGLRSTSEDMARFLRAVWRDSGSSIAPAALRLSQTLWPAPLTGGQQALGWEILPAPEGYYLSKDGVTANQCATVVLDLAGRAGVVVLSNTFPNLRNTSPSGGGVGAADLARHLLRPSIPLGV